MSKEELNELRQKLEIKKKKLEVEKATEKHIKNIKETLTYTTYDVFQDPSKRGRHFIMVKLQYNPDTKEAVVVDIRPFEDKTAGLSFVMDKDNRKYLFDKCRRSFK